MSQVSSRRCSFCLKREQEVSKIIAGAGSYICDECVALCMQILSAETPQRAAPEPDVPSWTNLTDEQILDRLPLIAASVGQVEEALEGWVTQARRRGISWARIGAALGISRQSAWERFVEAR
jgi:hypothetical protein